MFNNIEEISSNKYLNTLDNIVVKFGLNGRFVECTIPGWEGMYFVCGKDVLNVNTGNFNITELLQRKARYNEGLFHTDIHIIPITDRNPFSVTNDVLAYARNVEFISRVYGQHKMTLPNVITADGLNLIKLAHVNSINPSITQEERNGYVNLVLQTMEREKEIAKRASEGDLSTLAKLKGSWDSTLSDRQNEKNARSDTPNEVSLEHLITRSGMINVISVRYDKSEALRAELAKCSHAIYWMSAPYGERLSFPKGQGYGGDFCNDLRKVYLAFDAAHIDEIRYAITKTLYPAVFGFSDDFRDGKFGPVSRISIPVTQYHNFINLFKAGNIPFAYDGTCNSYRPNELNLIIPTNKEKSVEAVFDRLAKEIEGYHIETSWEKMDLQRYVDEQLASGKNILDLGSQSPSIGGGDGEK